VITSQSTLSPLLTLPIEIEWEIKYGLKGSMDINYLEYMETKK